MILLFVTNKVTLKLHHRNVHQWLSRHLQEHFGLQLVSLLEVGWKLHMLSYLLIPRFSFDHTNGFCGLLSDCPTLDKSCQQCLSGKFDLDNIQNARIQLYMNTSLGESTCEFMQCDVPGQCVGTFVNQITAQTHFDCQVRR